MRLQLEEGSADLLALLRNQGDSMKLLAGRIAEEHPLGARPLGCPAQISRWANDNMEVRTLMAKSSDTYVRTTAWGWNDTELRRGLKRRIVDGVIPIRHWLQV